MEDSNSKYVPRSEDVIPDKKSREDLLLQDPNREEPCETIPSNPKDDYVRVRRALGDRLIVIV